MKKNLQKSAILFGTKSNAYLQINRPIFAYSWLFLPIFAYLRICSKSPRIYFAFRAEYPFLFLPIFRHLTCERKLLKNHFVLGFVPFGGNFNDFMKPFISEMKELERGKIMKIQGQDAWVIAGLGSAGTGQCPRKISMSWTCPGHCPGHVPSKCPVQISHYIPL